LTRPRALSSPSAVAARLAGWARGRVVHARPQVRAVGIRMGGIFARLFGGAVLGQAGNIILAGLPLILRAGWPCRLRIWSRPSHYLFTPRLFGRVSRKSSPRSGRRLTLARTLPTCRALPALDIELAHVNGATFSPSPWPSGRPSASAADPLAPSSPRRRLAVVRPRSSRLVRFGHTR